jgi:hypothetical protein
MARAPAASTSLALGSALATLCGCVLLVWPAPAAGDDAARSLDDILAGFEDTEDATRAVEEHAEDARADFGRDVDAALEGFDDDIPAARDGSGDGEEAWGDEPLDDVLAGFADDGAPSRRIEDEASPADRFWEASGSLSLGASINVVPHRSSIGPDPSDPFEGTDYLGVQRFRTRGDLQVDVELPFDWELRAQGFLWFDFAYLMHGRDSYTDAVLNDYEFVAEVLDLWVGGTLFERLDVKLGRQVVNWGRSDTLRVTDVLNALDNREPGLTDIENLRLPATMAKLDYYQGPFTFTALVVPEIRYDYNPPAGSDFFTLPNLGDLPPPLPPLSLDDVLAGLDPADLTNLDFQNQRVPRWGANPEYGGAIDGIFSGWDVSFYAARIYQNQTSLTIGIPGSGVESALVSDRVTMIGGGGNYTLGSWLFKAELAWFKDLDYVFLQPVPPTSGAVYEVARIRSGRVDFMGGVEYYGIQDTTIALEVVNRHVIDWDPLLDYLPTYVEENTVEYALRVSSDWMNARLHTTLLALVLGARGEGGAILRGEVGYDLMDALVLSGGFVGYVPGRRPPLDGWGRNERVFLQLKYSF